MTRLEAMDIFVAGALALGHWVAMLFFLKFLRRTRDRLFLHFAIAFALLGTERLLLAAAYLGDGETYLLRVIRLAAFLLMIVGIVEKNRSSQSVREG